MGYGIELLTVCFHPKQGRNVIQVGITQPHYCFTVDCNYTFATSVISYEIAQRNSYSLMLIFWIFSPQGHSSLHPGQCWCFSGHRGHLFMSPSHPVSITHMTLDHITKSPSPNGKISSAPREFSIYVKSDIFFYYPRYVLHTCHHIIIHAVHNKMSTDLSVSGSSSGDEDHRWGRNLFMIETVQHFRPWNCRWV